ncbi:hypothetical protein FNH09_05260 [Streptomyces adustus]|uniref:Uncharacterized protein n=1 Tax=Streptomyces adustus TaxID=1609272 RepID=A0A5N8V6D2_9ACTN|nr:hypothetical protein [Streptomyces adustus]MPY30743.1 hypothetical protein [Streptomyces adustus]
MTRPGRHEICFSYDEDFDRFVEHVKEVTDVYRRMMEKPPGNLKAQDVLEAMASVPSRKIMTLANPNDREKLAALIVRRHGQLSAEKPITQGNLTAVAMAVAQRVGVRPGLENCVELAEAFLRRVFGRRIGTSAAQDDLGVGSNRVGDRLVPGGTWSPVLSQKQVFEALHKVGPEHIAVVLEQGEKGLGHVLFYAIVEDQTTREPKILRVDLQDRPAVADVPAPSLLPEHEWLRAGRGTRMIVIDHTGRSTDPAELSDVLQPQSAVRGQELVDGPTGLGYGALGFEFEVNNHPLSTTDGSALKSKITLAKNVNGFTLTTDSTTVFIVGGREFLSKEDAREFDRQQALLEQRPSSQQSPLEQRLMKTIEVVSPALDVTGKASLGVEDGMRMYAYIRERLGWATRAEIPVRLVDLFGPREGWTFRPAGQKVLVHPSVAGDNHPGTYPQFTVGANIGGASLIIALAQDRISKTKTYVQPAAAAARAFATDITTAFAAEQLGRPVEASQLDFLGRVTPYLREMEAYTWLMFSHASAVPLQLRFRENSLPKNMLPAALRNPFYALHESLSTPVQAFLMENERLIADRFLARLLEVVDHYQKQMKSKPVIPTSGIMEEHTYGKASHRDYLTAMIRGERLNQRETVGMEDKAAYESLDTKNGPLPLALFELRSLPRMDDGALFETSRELSDLANKAHSMALHFTGWDHTRTRARAARVIDHHLVKEAQLLLPYLEALQTPGQATKILSFVEGLTIAEAIAEHAAFRQPIPPEVIPQLEAARIKLLKALAPNSPIAQQHRPRYQQSLDGLLRLQNHLQARTRSAPRTVHASIALTDDPMRTGLAQALDDARKTSDPKQALIARLETQLQPWLPQGSQRNAPPQFTAPSAVESLSPTETTSSTVPPTPVETPPPAPVAAISRSAAPGTSSTLDGADVEKIPEAPGIAWGGAWQNLPVKPIRHRIPFSVPSLLGDKYTMARFAELVLQPLAMGNEQQQEPAGLVNEELRDLVRQSAEHVRNHLHALSAHRDGATGVIWSMSNSDFLITNTGNPRAGLIFAQLLANELDHRVMVEIPSGGHIPVCAQ